MRGPKDLAAAVAPFARRGVAASLLALVTAAAGCGKTPPPAEPPPPKVTVQHPEERELVDYDRYNGWTRASATVEVRSRVRGHIKQVHFTDGDVVKKNDLLFELDPRPFQADVDKAKDQLAIDEAQLEFAAADAARNEALFKNKTISKAENEKSAATHKTWEARVKASQQEIVRAQLDLDYSRITAEIPGRIGRALLTDGNLVNAGGSDPLLTTIVAIDPIHVYFSVDERSLLKYRKGHGRRIQDVDAAGSSSDGAAGDGQPTEPKADDPASTEPASAEPAASGAAASPSPPGGSSGANGRRANGVREAKIPFEFGFETEKGYPHQGTVDFADNRIDPETGTIEVRGSATNKDGEFVPGARVRVRVPISATYRAILVPDLAILSDQDQRYVLVVGDDNVVVRRNVSLGRLLDDGMRAVLPATEKHEGVSPKDWVIVLGLQRARINYPVEPVDADGKPIDRTSSAK